MWKYQCKNQLITLLCSFAIGVLLMVLTVGNSDYISVISEVMPDEVVHVFESNPYLIYLGGGLLISGLCNVFLIGNILSIQFGISSFLIFLIMMMAPSYAIMIGVYTLPVMLIVSLYGYISLKMKDRNLLKSRNISNDDELVRIYTIHHPLLEEYKEMAVSIRRQIRKVAWIYALGIVAVFCVMFLVDNLFVVIIVIFAYMMCFQFLARYRSQCFAPISSLLYTECNPEACMSALIYYSQRGSHYRLTNKALMATCLVYMDDPALAQDILITYPQANSNAVLTYWSLMSYIYYLLKDEAGLYRCKEEISKVKAGFGSMALMVKTNEANAVENKIRLVNRDFNTCKQYYLSVLCGAMTNLQKADAEYYIALISFVQEDYPVAKLYFERVLQIGNKIYFVRNASNYLEKINAMDVTEQYDEYTAQHTSQIDPPASQNGEAQGSAESQDSSSDPENGEPFMNEPGDPDNPDLPR